MAHAADNCSHTSVCAELVITRGNDRTNSSLVRHASVSKWSWFRPRPISANATTKLVEIDSTSDNDKLGDFRSYNHSAVAPSLPSDWQQNYSGTPTAETLTFNININELNIYELSSGSDVYYVFKAYLSTSDRTNGTNQFGSTTSVLVPRTTTTIPTGHTNNQTYKADSSSQQIDVDIDTTSLNKPNDIVYYDVYLGSNGGGTVYARFDDSYVDVTMWQYQTPYIAARGIPDLSPPTGYSQFEVCCTDASSTQCSSAVENMTQGTTNATFYHSQRGLRNSTPIEYRRVASTGTTVRLTITNARDGTGYPKYVTILSSGSYGTSSNVYYNTTSLGHTWQWDDVATLEIVTNGTIGSEGSSACAP